MLDGVPVKGVWWYFGHVLLLHIINHYPGMRRRSIVFLEAKIIFRALPSKKYQGVSQDVPIHHATLMFLSRSTRGALPSLRYTPTPTPPHPHPPQTWTGTRPAWSRAVLLVAVEALSLGRRQGTPENVTHLPGRRGTKQPQSSSAFSVPSLDGAGDDC